MKSYWKLLKFVKHHKANAFWNVVFNLLAVLFTLVSLTMLKPIMDLLFMDTDTLVKYLKPNPHAEWSREYLEYQLNQYFAQNISYHPEGALAGKKYTLILICILTASSFLLKNLFIYLGKHVLAPIRTEMITQLRKKAYSVILRLPNSYFSDERKGDILSRMTSDVKEVEYGLVSMQSLVKEPITIVVFLIGLLYIDVKLTLIIIVLSPFSTLIMAKIGRSLKKTSAKSQSKIGEVMSIFEESLTGLKIIKAYTVEKIVSKKFDEANDRFFVLETRVHRKWALASPLSETVGIGIFCIVLYFGGSRVFEGNMQGSTFTTFLLYLYGLITPIKAYSNAINSLHKSSASLDRIEEILEAPITIENPENPIEFKGFNQSIQLKNISFKYQDNWVIQDLNLYFEKGKSYALVGHSGSGKSTLADLIPRFIDVNKGEILIDGINIKDITLKQLRSLTGIVTQESILFNDTVWNNLTFGEENIAENDVLEALKTANAYDFVMELPNGLHTPIGEGGGKLSGGQKQRLCIARAVLKNPPILILDEATSALDAQSELVVQDALNKVMQNRTSIIIAHRLSTIKNVDEIIVLDKGKIIEQGTHQQLLQNNAAYKKLVEMQNVHIQSEG